MKTKIVITFEDCDKVEPRFAGKRYRLVAGDSSREDCPYCALRQNDELRGPATKACELQSLCGVLPDAYFIEETPCRG